MCISLRINALDGWLCISVYLRGYPADIMESEKQGQKARMRCQMFTKLPSKSPDEVDRLREVEAIKASELADISEKKCIPYLRVKSSPVGLENERSDGPVSKRSNNGAWKKLTDEVSCIFVVW